jgi:hypothetical protein
MFSNNNGSSRCIECVVCKAAGKSDNLGHFIRNDKGTVVCPTLLDQNCRHCGQKGHTPKYCIIKKQEERQERRATFQNIVATEDKKTTKNKNAFGALDDDSSSDNDEDVKKPVVSAAVVDKMTKEEMRQALCDILGVRNAVTSVVADAAEPVSKPAVVSVPFKRRLWSEMMDDSDSDDE